MSPTPKVSDSAHGVGPGLKFYISQAMLMLLVQGHHFENHRINMEQEFHCADFQMAES